MSEDNHCKEGTCASAKSFDDIPESLSAPQMLIDDLNDLLSKDIVDFDDIFLSDESEEIAASEEFLKQERDSYIKIDLEFSRFLKNFVDAQAEKETQKNELKEQFFCIIMIGFLLLLVTPIIIILCAKSFSDLTLITALISVVIELVSAIIILPEIIAKYLFSKEEDANMLQIIKNMQDYNEKKHIHINENSKQKN